MTNDSEPRYRLVDSNGNVVGSLYAKAGGTLAIQEGTSGADNEVTVATDGTLTTPALHTDSARVKSVDVTVDEFTLADDSATSFSDFSESQGFHIGSDGAIRGHALGLLIFKEVHLAASKSANTVANTQLTGTTGTDGSLNLSMASETLYVENRTGGSADYRLLRFNMF